MNVSLALRDAVSGDKLDAMPLTAKSPRATCADTAPNRLATHQATSRELVKVLLQGEGRGLLLWHSAGAGKTLTAAAAIDMAWDTGRRIIYLTNTQGLAANPPATFHGYMAVAGRFKGRSAEHVAEAFRKRGVEFWSFARLAHLLQLHRPRKAKDDAEEAQWKEYLRDALIIVDEAHTLAKPTAGQSKEFAALRELLADPGRSRTRGAKLVLMTATPGDDVASVLRLLNVIRQPERPEIRWPTRDPDAFAAQVAGLVSFFDASPDKSRFPVSSETVHRASMSIAQASALAGKAGTQPSPERLRELLRKGRGGTYWNLARAYSNTLFARPRGQPLSEFSSKLALLVQTIALFPDHKHYVYTQYHERRGFGGHGARAIVRALVQDAGYREWVQGTPVGGAPGVALLAGPSDAGGVVEAFNDAKNDSAAAVRVLVATQRFNEGIDLKSVRHVHIFEPLVEPTADEQAVGRAVRFCSHARLPHDQWTVTVHRYVATVPDVSRELESALTVVERVKAGTASARKEQTWLKGVRGGAGVAARRDHLAGVVRALVAAQKVGTGEVRALQKVAAAPAVDSLVHEAVTGARADIARLLQDLRDASVDCLAFERYHRAGGVAVKCRDSPARKKTSGNHTPRSVQDSPHAGRQDLVLRDSVRSVERKLAAEPTERERPAKRAERPAERSGREQRRRSAA